MMGISSQRDDRPRAQRHGGRADPRLALDLGTLGSAYCISAAAGVLCILVAGIGAGNPIDE
jgi:hypothetical protein